MTDAAFLAALVQTPDDAALRAVYADFLDDAGRHDEAELLRADEAMRRVAVWSDEYWTLKNRRNELRRSCEPEWLRLTALDGTRPQRLFRDGYPDGVRDRWRFIRAFTEQWHEVELPDVGGQAEAIEVEERELGLTFGPSLREYVALAHDLNDGWTNGMVFGNPYHLEQTADGEAVSIMLCAEGSTMWAVALSDAGEEDPPVRQYDYDQEQRFVLAGGHRSRTQLTRFILDAAVGNTFDFHFVSDGVDVATLALMFSSQATVPATDEHFVRWESDQGVRIAFVSESEYPPLASVHIPPKLPWRFVPASVWEFSRRGRWNSGIQTLSPDDVAELSAVFGDDPPEWFARR